MCTTFTTSGDRRFWLKAFRGECSVTDTVLVHVSGCRPPFDVTPTPSECGKVVVTWNDSAAAADRFCVYRDGARIGCVSADGRSYTDFPRAGTYTYCVRSFCGLDSSTGVCGAVTSCPDSLIYDLSFYPNPVQERGHLTYTLLRESGIRVEIFTLRGRHIRDLSMGGTPPGRHEIEWDLTTQEGTVVGNGVYICRFTATAISDGVVFQKTMKVSVVK